MKKTLGIAVVALFAFGLSSCVKDYDCNCTTTVTVNGQSTTSSSTVTVKGNKKVAEEACKAFENSTTTCTI